MTIPKLTPYTGQVANPDGSQTQAEFTQNMFDQLSYEAQLANELNATVNATNTTASEVDSNAAIAQNSADTAQAAANFEGNFTAGVTSAVKGKSYLYSGNVWLCLQNTTSTPSASNAAWKLSIGEQYVTEAQEDLLPPGSKLFKGRDGVTVKDGDTVPAGTTHLRVLIQGKATIVSISPVADGVVSSLTETSAVIGATAVELGVNDLTKINDDVIKIASRVTRYGQSINVVVTGGSVSFNGFGYPGSWAVNGAGYATDAPFGLSSWSYLMRDYFIASHPMHRPINELCIDKQIGVSLETISATDSQRYGLNCRAASFYFSSTSSVLRLKAGSFHFQYLLIASFPSGDGDVTFDVNGTPENSTSQSSNYRGYNYKKIRADGDVEITNVKQADNSFAGGRIVIYGITGSGDFNFNITGKGGYDSGQILAEYSTLIGAYSPEILFLMVGGNDVGNGVPIATYKLNISQIVDNVRATNPDAIVILTGPTPNTLSDSDALIKYNRAMREVSDEKGCSMVDVLYKMSQTDGDYWRHDNTHFNINGDTMVFNIFKQALFNTVSVDNSKFVPSREYFVGVNSKSWFENDAARGNDSDTNASIKATATTPTITPLEGSGLTATYTGTGVNSVMEISWENDGVLSGFFPLYTAGASSARVVPYQGISGNSVSFIALDSAGNRIDINGCDAFFRVNIDR